MSPGAAKIKKSGHPCVQIAEEMSSGQEPSGRDSDDVNGLWLRKRGINGKQQISDCAQEKLDRSRNCVSRTWEEIFRMSPRMGSR